VLGKCVSLKVEFRFEDDELLSETFGMRTEEVGVFEVLLLPASERSSLVSIKDIVSFEMQERTRLTSRS
jgi:hypothetical protein